MTGEPHQVTLGLTEDEPAEAGLRRLVTDHYQRFLPGQTPPQASGLAAFAAGLPICVRSVDRVREVRQGAVDGADGLGGGGRHENEVRAAFVVDKLRR
ncbi:hypothetical protein ACWC3X_02330 [Streptomyces populi]